VTRNPQSEQEDCPNCVDVLPIGDWQDIYALDQHHAIVISRMRRDEERVMATEEQNEEWAIVELMGHRRLAGRVSEVKRFGVELLRLDVPKADGFTTQFYNGAALYCVTPTTQDIARAVAAGSQPAPVSRFELPPARTAVNPEDGESEDDELGGF